MNRKYSLKNIIMLQGLKNQFTTEEPRAPPYFSEEPGAQSGLLWAPRAPTGSTEGALIKKRRILAFQCFKLDLFIFFSFQTVI